MVMLIMMMMIFTTFGLLNSCTKSFIRITIIYFWSNWFLGFVFYVLFVCFIHSFFVIFSSFIHFVVYFFSVLFACYTQSRGNRHTLTIRNVTYNDLGNYTCQASNNLGKDRASLTLSGIPSVCTFDSVSDIETVVDILYNIN